MKKLLAALFIMALAFSSQAAFAEDEGLHLGGLDKDQKKEAIEAKTEALEANAKANKVEAKAKAKKAEHKAGKKVKKAKRN